MICVTFSLPSLERTLSWQCREIPQNLTSDLDHLYSDYQRRKTNCFVFVFLILNLQHQPSYWGKEACNYSQTIRVQFLVLTYCCTITGKLGHLWTISFFTCKIRTMTKLNSTTRAHTSFLSGSKHFIWTNSFHLCPELPTVIFILHIRKQAQRLSNLLKGLL